MVYSLDETTVKATESRQKISYLTEEPISSVTEGKHYSRQTTMMTQNRIRSDFVGLCTVPVILKNGDRSVTVNALVDDASTDLHQRRCCRRTRIKR